MFQAALKRAAGKGHHEDMMLNSKVQSGEEGQSVWLVSEGGSAFSAASVLVCSDVVALVLSASIAQLLFGPFTALSGVLAFVGAQSFVLGLALVGLYPGRGVWGPERIRMRGLMVLISFLSPGMAGLLLQLRGINIGAMECTTVGILAFFFASFLEIIAIRIADSLGWWRSRVAFVGDDAHNDCLKRNLALYPELGWELVEESGPMTFDMRLSFSPSTANVTGGLGTFACDPSFLAAFYRSGSQAILHGSFGRGSSASKAVKRVMDIFGAAGALMISIPVWAAVAVAIYLVDNRPIFFRQPRGGLEGRVVHVLKFRSMYRDAQEKLEHLLAEDPEAREEWNRHCKLNDDPRILPKIGSFIRRTSIDEIPQFWNVLKGDMSLVGPRPFPENHLTMFSQEFQNIRSSVLPGLSGLLQVTLRSNAELSVQEQVDRTYIDSWSIWLDLYILFRTPVALICAEGAR